MAWKYVENPNDVCPGDWIVMKDGRKGYVDSVNEDVFYLSEVHDNVCRVSDIKSNMRYRLSR